MTFSLPNLGALFEMLPKEVREGDDLVKTDLKVKKNSRGFKRHSSKTGGLTSLMNNGR